MQKIVANEQSYQSIYINPKADNWQETIVFHEPVFDDEIPGVIALKSLRLENCLGFVLAAPKNRIRYFIEKIKDVDTEEELGKKKPQEILSRLLIIAEEIGGSVVYIQNDKTGAPKENIPGTKGPEKKKKKQVRKKESEKGKSRQQQETESFFEPISHVVDILKILADFKAGDTPEIKWSYPTDKELLNEIKSEYKIESLFITEMWPKDEHYKYALQDLKQIAKEEQLDPKKVKGYHQYWETYDDLYRTVKSYGGPKDPESMLKAIDEGKPLPMPVAVRRMNGEVEILGGATRSGIAKLADQPVTALVIDEKIANEIIASRLEHEGELEAKKEGYEEIFNTIRDYVLKNGSKPTYTDKHDKFLAHLAVVRFERIAKLRGIDSKKLLTYFDKTITSSVVVEADFKTVEQKYLDQGIDKEIVNEYLKEFKKLRDTRDLGENKDIDKWGKKPWKEFKDFVDKTKEEKTKTAEKKLKRIEGADLIAENDAWYVYKIKTLEASKLYGSGTKWCITQENSWKDYTRNSVFYFLISKKLDENNPLYKIAVRVKKEDFTDNVNEIFFWDAEDNNIKEIPKDVPNIEFKGIGSEDILTFESEDDTEIQFGDVWVSTCIHSYGVILQFSHGFRSTEKPQPLHNPRLEKNIAGIIVNRYGFNFFETENPEKYYPYIDIKIDTKFDTFSLTCKQVLEIGKKLNEMYRQGVYSEDRRSRPFINASIYSPAPGRYPKDINPINKPIWDKATSNLILHTIEGNKERWYLAKERYQNLCKDLEINPYQIKCFDDKDDIKKDIRQRMGFATQTLRDINGDGISLRLKDVSFANGYFNIITETRLTENAISVAQDFKCIVTGQYRNAIKQLDDRISITISDNEKEVTGYINYQLPLEDAERLFDLDTKNISKLRYGIIKLVNGFKYKPSIIEADFKTVKLKFLTSAPEEVIDNYFKKFKELKDKHRILETEKKDIEYWGKKPFEDFKKYVDQLSEEKSGRQQKKELHKIPQKIEGATIVAQNDLWVVYKIETYEANEKLGSRDWCITRNEKAWDEYNQQVDFYFFISLIRDKDDRFYKIAMGVSNRGIVYWDNFDKTYYEDQMPDLGRPKFTPDIFKRT